MSSIRIVTSALLVAVLFSWSAVPVQAGVIVDPKKNNKHLKECKSDDDCSYQRSCAYDQKFDEDDDPAKLVCLHKTLFPHISLRDVMTVIVIFLATMMAASAGIGGGGLNSPIYILLTGFLIQEAVPLSHITVFGNSLAQFVINFRQKHPFVQSPGKPLIDYAVPLIMLPPQLGGNNLGVLLNPMIPPDILIVLAELLLAYATFRVFQKGIAMYKAEAEVAAAARAGEEDEESSYKSITTEHSDVLTGLYHPKQDGHLNASGSGRAFVASGDEEDAERIREEESKIPLNYVGLMVAFWALFAGAYVGLKEFGKCSTGYWVILAVMYPMLLLFLWVGVRWINRDNKRRAAAGLPPIEGDVEWTPQKLILAPLAAGGVGLVAGLLGLGGGELMAPLLLEIGMLPKAASATSAYMIIWTTSSDIIHYSISGDLPEGYSTVFCVLGFVGGLLGRWLAIRFVAKSGRQSIIALALGCVLALSMGLFAYRAATSDQKNPWWPFQGPCN